jgi:hypothetical protein
MDRGYVDVLKRVQELADSMSDRLSPAETQRLNNLSEFVGLVTHAMRGERLRLLDTVIRMIEFRILVLAALSSITFGIGLATFLVTVVMLLIAWFVSLGYLG